MDEKDKANILGRIEALKERVESLGDKEDSPEGISLIEQFDLGKTYFNIGALYKLLDVQKEAENWFKLAKSEMEDLHKRAPMDAIRLNYEKMIGYSGLPADPEVKPVEQPKKGLFAGLFGSSQPSEQPIAVNGTIDDVIDSVGSIERALIVRDERKALEIQVNGASKYVANITKALAAALSVASVSDDYGKNGVEFEPGYKPGQPVIEIMDVPADDENYLLSKQLDSQLKGVTDPEQRQAFELLKAMLGARIELPVDIGNAGDRAGFYFKIVATRILANKGMVPELNKYLGQTGMRYDSDQAWEIAKQAIPALQVVDEIGIPQLCLHYATLTGPQRAAFKEELTHNIQLAIGEEAKPLTGLKGMLAKATLYLQKGRDELGKLA